MSKKDRLKKLTAKRSKEEPKGKEAKAELLSGPIPEVATETDIEAETETTKETESEPIQQVEKQNESKTEEDLESQVAQNYQQEVAITIETGASDPSLMHKVEQEQTEKAVDRIAENEPLEGSIDPTLLEAVKEIRVNVMTEKPKWEELYVGRYVSLERKVSERLDQISQRKGDIQKHINNALKLYFQVIGYPLD